MYGCQTFGFSTKLSGTLTSNVSRKFGLRRGLAGNSKFANLCLEIRSFSARDAASRSRDFLGRNAAWK